MAQEGPGWAKMIPRWVQVGRKKATEGPKVGQVKMALGGGQDGPSWPQEGTL